MSKILSLQALIAIHDVVRENKMTEDQKSEIISKLLGHIEASCPKPKVAKLSKTTNFKKGSKVFVQMNGQKRPAEILGFENGFYSAKVFPVKRGKTVIRDYVTPNLISM